MTLPEPIRLPLARPMRPRAIDMREARELDDESLLARVAGPEAAASILATIDGLAELAHLDAAEVARLPGVGRARASRIVDGAPRPPGRSAPGSSAIRPTSPTG